KKRPLCCSDSATSTPVPTGKQNNFTAVWSKLFTCVIITFLLCLLNYMGNVSAFQRLLSDGVFGCINGKQNVGMSRYSLFQYGQHTIQLLLLRHGIRTRTGGFSPNIDKVCSLIHHLINMLKRQFNSIEAPSIRKGVGRHV